MPLTPFISQTLPSSRISRPGEVLLRGLFCLIVATLLAASFLQAVRATYLCLWPSEWDLLRDIGMAQVILDGRYPADTILPNETLWFNPLTGGILALAHWVSGISLPRLGILLGPALNLITPLGLVVLLAGLFGRSVALAGLCMVLYGKYPPNPFWVQLSYAPWLMAPLYASGLLFFTLTAYYAAVRRRSTTCYVLAGALLGITFMAHTAPAIVGGGAMFIHFTVELFVNRRIRSASKAECVTAEMRCMASRFLLLLTVAFVVSLPFTGSILWNYGFRIRNPYPALFTADYVTLAQLPTRLRESVNWRNGLALFGVIVLLRCRSSAARLTLAWLFVACVLLAHHYLIQLLYVRYGRILPGFAPGHHWALHLSAVRAVLFAVGAGGIGRAMARGCSTVWCVWRNPLSQSTSGRLQRIASLVVACIAGTALYAAHPLSSRMDFQQPQMELYHQYHQMRIPVYEWILANTSPDAVFLCFEDAIALTVVMPTARKLLFPMRIYTSPYVATGPLSKEKRLLVEAIQGEDDSTRCEALRHYPELYLLLREEEMDDSVYSRLSVVREVFRAGGLVVLRAGPC